MGFMDNFRDGLENVVKTNVARQDQMIRKMPDEGILHNMVHAKNEVAREKCRMEAERRGLI